MIPKILLIGSEPVSMRKIPEQFPGLQDEFLGEIEWKRVPETVYELEKLVISGPCVVDIDSLDSTSIQNLAEIRLNSPKAHGFWVYSKSQCRLVELAISRCKPGSFGRIST